MEDTVALLKFKVKPKGENHDRAVAFCFGGVCDDCDT